MLESCVARTPRLPTLIYLCEMFIDFEIQFDAAFVDTK